MRYRFQFVKKCDYGIICNSHSSKQIGEHWIAIYLPETGITEYFDSFGEPPKIKSFSNFLGSSEYVYNNLQVQSETGITCGHYCIFFLLCRFIGVSFKDVISFFSPSDLSINDGFVFDFIKM